MQRIVKSFSFSYFCSSVHIWSAFTNPHPSLSHPPSPPRTHGTLSSAWSPLWIKPTSSIPQIRAERDQSFFSFKVHSPSPHGKHPEIWIPFLPNMNPTARHHETKANVDDLETRFSQSLWGRFSWDPSCGRNPSPNGFTFPRWMYKWEVCSSRRHKATQSSFPWLQRPIRGAFGGSPPPGRCSQMDAHQHSPDSSSEECTVLEAPPGKNTCLQHAGKVKEKKKKNDRETPNDHY